MSYLEIFLLALALSVDACVLSFSYGLVFHHMRKKNSMLLASFTGIFQGIMPVIGYFLTSLVKNYIMPYAEVLILVIFCFLGLKFIKEAFDKKQEPSQMCLGVGCLFLAGVATSIDAFSAGISLSLFGNKILKPAVLIAFITFINSHLGFWLGGKLKNLPTKRLEIMAGLILIFLGIKAVL